MAAPGNWMSGNEVMILLLEKRWRSGWMVDRIRK